MRQRSWSWFSRRWRCAANQFEAEVVEADQEVSVSEVAVVEKWWLPGRGEVKLK